MHHAPCTVSNNKSPALASPFRLSVQSSFSLCVQLVVLFVFVSSYISCHVRGDMPSTGQTDWYSLDTKKNARCFLFFCEVLNNINISQAVSLHECVFGEVILELNKKCSFNCCIFSSAAQWIVQRIKEKKAVVLLFCCLLVIPVALLLCWWVSEWWVGGW